MDELGAKKLVYFYCFTRTNKGNNFGNILRNSQFNTCFNKKRFNMPPNRKNCIKCYDTIGEFVEKKNL